MGDAADDILRSFKLTEADSKVYETVKEKFESHFVKRRNVIFERAKFNNRKQEQGEPVDAFITALYTLAEHCNYGALYDEMIRDRIVVGLRNLSLSEKLQLDAGLTLATAVTKVRQAEAVKKQQPLLRGETPATAGRKHDLPVGAVQRGKWLSKGSRQNTKPKATTHYQFGRNSQSQGTCTRCGKSPHDRQSCPARDAVCRKCSKRGHFQAVCRSSARVGEIHQVDPPEAFLGGVDTQGTPDNPWRLSLMLNGTPTEFEINTGAEVTAISKERHEKIGSPPLSRPSQTLKGPSDYSLPVTGCFTGLLKRGSQEVQQQIYVVRNLRRQLLGRPAIEALELAVQVGAIFDEGATPVQMFPQLFEGLGKLEGEYAIKLAPDQTPSHLPYQFQDE